MIHTHYSNYPCLEHIFTVPKLFEPLKFGCIVEILPLKVFPFIIMLFISGILAVGDFLHFRLNNTTFTKCNAPGRLIGLVRYLLTYPQV